MSFSVCVGADAFLDLTAGLWKESDRILSFFADTDTSSPSPLSVPPNYRRAASSNRQLLVLHRSSSPANESPAGATNNNGSSVEAQEKQKNDDLVLARRVQDTAGSRLIRIGSLGSISSSQVRACLDTEQLTRVVVPSILEYIQRNHLYQFSVE